MHPILPTAPDLRWALSPTGANFPRDSFFNTAWNGRPAKGMPAWNVLLDSAAIKEVYLYVRSEEHTSELQSQSNLVCRLLLEKKNDQPDIEAERKKRDEIEAGKSYCSRRFGGATSDDKSAPFYARFDTNDWRIQPAEFDRFHDSEVNTFGYF